MCARVVTYTPNAEADFQDCRDGYAPGSPARDELVRVREEIHRALLHDTPPPGSPIGDPFRYYDTYSERLGCFATVTYRLNVDANIIEVVVFRLDDPWVSS